MDLIQNVTESYLSKENIVYYAKCAGCNNIIETTEFVFIGLDFKYCDECGSMYLPYKNIERKNIFDIFLEKFTKNYTKKKEKKQEFVYIAFSELFFKIGVTSNISKRIKQFNFNIKDCFLIKTENARKLERHLHKKFSDYNYSKELFRIECVYNVLNYVKNEIKDAEINKIDL